MAAVGDEEALRVVEDRAAVAVEPRGFGERAEHIESATAAAVSWSAARWVTTWLAELEETSCFELLGALVGAEDLVLHLLELRGDEALAVGHGLLARVVVGDVGEVRLGDLDEVAEDGVELDLQRLDAGALAFVFLEAGRSSPCRRGRRAEFVELGRLAVADDAAVAEVGGRLVGEGAFEEFGEVGEVVETIDD